jgi:hypothetical protein
MGGMSYGFSFKDNDMMQSEEEMIIKTKNMMDED